jgi:hypothetical protein
MNKKFKDFLTQVTDLLPNIECFFGISFIAESQVKRLFLTGCLMLAQNNLEAQAQMQSQVASLQNLLGICG